MSRPTQRSAIAIVLCIIIVAIVNQFGVDCDFAICEVITSV